MTTKKLPDPHQDYLCLVVAMLWCIHVMALINGVSDLSIVLAVKASCFSAEFWSAVS